MARPSHHKRLEKQRARRRAERAEHRRALRHVLALVAVLVVAAVALGAVFLNRGNADQAATDASTATHDAAVGADGAGDGEDGATGAEPCGAPTGDLPEPHGSPYDERPTVDLGDAEVVRAEIATTCGVIAVELDAAAAPTTVNNFVALAEDGYYEGAGFHRVIDTFMIQGGDPTGTGTGCLDDACEQRLPGYTFDDELALAEQLVDATGGYPRGTLAMANSGADTNGSQFFIIQGENGYPLPPQYGVFGSVVEGMDVVDRIAQGPVDGQLAVDPVIILSVDVLR